MSNNENIKVSIVIPIYNVEEYLDACLESLKNQTHTNFEAILVDNATKDSSGDIAKKYATEDDRFKYLFESNPGVSNARNAGLEVVSADWLTFVDSDDKVDPKYLETLLGNAIENNCDWSMCGVNMDKNNMGRDFFVSSTEGKKTNKELFELFLNGDFVPAIYNKLLSREIFDGLRFDTRYDMGEDTLFTCQALARAKAGFISNDLLYLYTVREGSLMNSEITERKLKSIESAETVKSIVDGIYPDLKELTKRYIFFTIKFMQSQVSTQSSKSEYIEFLNKKIADLGEIDFSGFDMSQLEFLDK
jgi:glycosyltransferase involved in cell wall biosynthesis